MSSHLANHRCLASTDRDSVTSDFRQVTCIRCLKNLIKTIPSGTKLASEISIQIQDLK